jgi:hypothetical protein
MKKENILKKKFLSLSLVAILLAFTGCGKQGPKLTYEEKLEKDINIHLNSISKKYRKEFHILEYNDTEKNRIKKIGKIVGSINYKTTWSERLLGRDLSRNNIPFHTYNENLDKDIHNTKKFIKRINSVKYYDDFINLKSSLEKSLTKLKEIFFLVRKNSNYREESRYIRNIKNHRDTQWRLYDLQTR